MFFLLLAIALLISPLPAMAQVTDTAAAHPPELARDSVTAPGLRRFRNALGDSGRVDSEMESLKRLLSLDDTQAVLIRSVLRHRDNRLWDLRSEPIRDRQIRFLRMQKIVAEADRDIEINLSAGQQKEYGKFKRERQLRLDEREDQRPQRGHGGQCGGHRGLSGQAGSWNL